MTDRTVSYGSGLRARQNGPLRRARGRRAVGSTLNETSVVHPQTLGVVLAGGLARRMGGGDKTAVRIGGATLFERVLRRLGPQCTRIILSSGDAARFSGSGLIIVADSVPGHAGPLAGILAALEWTAEHAPDIAWVVSAPGDCPFLPRDLVARLHVGRIEAGAPLACASSSGRRHPVVGLWAVALRQDLRRALVQERVRKVDLWAARYGVAVVEWPVAPVDPFFNVNTPEDVGAAGRLAAQYPDV